MYVCMYIYIYIYISPSRWRIPLEISISFIPSAHLGRFSRSLTRTHTHTHTNRAAPALSVALCAKPVATTPSRFSSVELSVSRRPSSQPERGQLCRSGSSPPRCHEALLPPRSRLSLSLGVSTGQPSKFSTLSS